MAPPKVGRDNTGIEFTPGLKVMKVLKWILIAAGAVVVIFAVAIAFIALTFDPNQYKAQAAALVKDKTQRTLTFEGDIRLTLFPKLGIHLGKTSLSEAHSEKNFAGLDDVRVSLALLPLLSKRMVVDQVQLEGLHATLVQYKDGKTNFDDLLGAKKAENQGTPPKRDESAQATLPIKLEVEGVRLSNAQLVWKDEGTGATYAISDVNLKTGRVAPGVPTKFALGAVIKGNEPKVDVKLDVAGMLLADLDKQLFSVADLLVTLKGGAAGLANMAAEATGRLEADLKKQSATADLAIKVGASNIKAQLAVEDFVTLRSRFDIAVDKLNLDQYLPANKTGEKTAAPAGAQAEQPIDFSPIKKLDVTGSLRVGEFIAANIKTQNLRVDVKAKNGRLEIDPLTATLYQGSVKGTASVDANTNRIATRQNLTGVAIGPLLRDASSQDLLEGRGNVALDLTTGGNLVSAMKKSLSGTARLELKDGAIKGIDVAKSLRNAKAFLRGGKQEAEQGAAAGEKTDFSELTASFDIKNGIAHNSDLVVKSPFLRLTGEGDVNLADSSLNYLAKASVVTTSAGQGGEDRDDLKGITIPVRAYGAFTALRYKVELGSLLSDSAKQKLQGQKENLKSKVEEALRSRLPGAPAQPEPAPGQAPAAQPKAEDKLKEKLKKLF